MNKNTISLVGLFALSPLLAFPFIAYGIYCRNRLSLVLLAAFMALFAFQTAPTGDLFRHTMDYYHLKGMTLPEFLIEMSESKDVLFYSISYAFGRFGIPFGFVKAFVLFVETCIINYIFNYIVNHSGVRYTRRQVFLRYALVFLSFNWFGAILGLRYALAVSLFLLSVHFWLDRRALLPAVLFGAMSVLTHFSFLYFIGCAVLFLYLPLTRAAILAAAVVSLTASPFLLSTFTEFFLEEEMSDSVYLGSGHWGAGFTDYVSTNMIIFLWIARICAIPYFILLVKHFTSKNNYAKLCVLFFCIFLCTSELLTLSRRTLRVFLILSPFSLLLFEKLKARRFSPAALRIVTVSMSLFFASQIYARRGTFQISHYERLLFPVPAALHDSFDQAWLNRNVTDSGMFIEK